MKKRMLSFLLIIALMLSLGTMTAAAAGSTSGTCGDSARWSFNPSTGVLTISGSGEVEFNFSDIVNIANQVKTIEVGANIESLGEYFGDHGSYVGTDGMPITIDAFSDVPQFSSALDHFSALEAINVN